ncbi:MAG: hypothetical protein WCP11_00520 [Candidatus Saccharibacteria bacterium]
MNIFKSWFLAIIMTISLGGIFVGVAAPQPVSAINCDGGFLTFPTWYKGLTKDAECTLKSPEEYSPTAGDKALSVFIWRIVLNGIEILLQLVGYISVGFILFGGFKYVTGAGSADAIQKAKASVTNAAIGLVIALLSVGIIRLITSLWM